MLIKSVELKNIKSYTHETIEFMEGINGICGMNGHGKTTLLEAIGYVLFDYLPYSEKDFKRRGENSAYVTVEVLANGAIYNLTKKLGGEFTVRGPNTNITGKKDALAWIAHNLFPFSSLDELPGIFENAVGVPQGMFTAAFMYPPTKRQKTFDEILKVEEYRKAYDNLRDTMALIDKDINSIENDINGLRIRTEGYEKKKVERNSLKVSIENLKKGLKENNESLNSVKITLEALRKQKEELEKLNSETKQLNAKLEGQNQQLKKNMEELVRSEEAQKIISDLSGMKEKYEDGRKNLEKLDELRKNREVLLDKLTKIQNDLSLLNDKKMRINLLKAETEKKTNEKNAILPFVNEQIELEKKRDTTNQERAIYVKEIDDIKSRMSLAGAENICPVMKDVRCNSVNNFSEYFKEHLVGVIRNLNISMNSLKTLESQLNELGDPRSKAKGFEMLIKNHTEEAARLIKETESSSEKEKEANLLKIELEKYSTLDGDMAGAKNQIKELEPFYRKYLQNQSLAVRVAEYKKECENLQKSIVEGGEKLKDVQKQCNEIHKGLNDADLVQTQRAYEEMLAKVRGIQVEIKEKEAQLQKLNRDIFEIEKYLADIAALDVKLDNEKRFRDYAKFIRETLRDSGQHIVIELIGEIGEEANNLYGSIMDDFSQELRWSEDYEIKIIDSGEEKIFQQLSGGEKMGAALAVRLALLKILSNSDFVFLDEPTQNMDEIRRENLSEQITKIKGFKQVFVISHDDTFNEKYAHVIKVQKIDGQSRVESCSI